MLRKVPLIVILGSTGTGKTKLSIELAQRFGGEIISADSMQVYANLNIASAKATKEEQSRAKHHLLDVATPTEPYSVLNFRNAALPIIENLSAQSKCPIVVGGTNYYIEALLWDILINTEASEASKTTTIPTSSTRTTSGGNKTSSGISQNVTSPPHYPDAEMLKMSSQSLYDHLRIIDPESTNRLHPNNKRKIIRAIEVYQQTGQTFSSILQEQRRRPGANRLGGPLRYPHTIMLWLRCKQEILNQRLDQRVDSMLEQGLLQELRNFYNEHKLCDLSGSIVNATTEDNLYTKGVLQTIGFKEFIPYLEQFDESNDQKIEEYLRSNDFKMPTEEQFKANYKRCCPENSDANNQSSTDGPIETSQSPSSSASPSSLSLPTSCSSSLSASTSMASKEKKIRKSALPPGLEQLNACLNELKLVTRRYSKKQIKWINNRFLASRDRQVPDLYELDSSDVSFWNENVYQRAVTIIENYRNGEVCEIQPMAKRQHPGADLNEETTHFCDICQRHFVGDFQFGLHMKSNKHKRRKETQRKREKLANDVKKPENKTTKEKDLESDQSFPMH